MNVLNLLHRSLQRPSVLALFAAVFLVSSHAAAQDDGNLDSSLDGSNPPSYGPEVDMGEGYFVPGMPVPKKEQAQKGTGETGEKDGGAKNGRANRISKITKVERGSAIEDATRVQTLKIGDIYQGIVPGINNWHLFARRARDAARANPNRANKMTWLGFQPFEKGSRVFVQTIKPATYSVDEVSREDGSHELRITLLGTRTPIRNNRRTLDTSYFRSAVIGARAARSGRDTVVVIDLQKKVPYELQQDAEFLYITFDDAGSQSFADQKRSEESADQDSEGQDEPANKEEPAQQKPDDSGAGLDVPD